MHTSSAFVHLPALVLALAAGAAADGVWATPHDSYSSSVGVLGCKINTNRVAYWPGSVDCNNLCVKLSYGGRSVYLLRIDQSGGAYDISYDAWNYLQTGQSATTDPIAGGAVAMDYEDVDASECAGLIYTDGSKLPLSASNSMNFVSSCLAQPSSWVANNYVLYNILDPICSLGYDEVCSLNLAVSNQASCPHILGLDSKLTTTPVYNIEYPSGQTVDASTGEVVPADVSESGSASSPSAQVSSTGAVFLEYTSTPVPAEQPITTTSYPVSSSTTQAPTTTVTLAGNSSSQYTVSSSAGQPSTMVSSTISVGTVSSRPSTTSNSPTSVPSVQPVNAGHAAASVSALALVSSMIICSILNAF